MIKILRYTLLTQHFDSITMLSYFQHSGKFLNMSLVFNTSIDFIFKAIFFMKTKANMSIENTATASYSFNQTCSS